MMMKKRLKQKTNLGEILTNLVLFLNVSVGWPNPAKHKKEELF